jgi:ATP-dependent Clp protease protease subunit
VPYHDRSGGTSSAVVGKTLIYSGEVDDNFFSFLWENLLLKGAEIWEDDTNKAKEDRRLILNSGGGDTETSFSVIDLFEHVEILTTVATGSCYSAAVPIVACGTPGYRCATPRTRFMLHSPWGAPDGDTEAHTEVARKEFERVRLETVRALVKYTKKSHSFWNAKLKRDEGIYFGPEEALEWGIIDKILKPRF